MVRDRRAANFRADIVRTAAQLCEHGASGLQMLLVACLDHYTALAELLGRQPAVGQVQFPASLSQTPCRSNE